MFLLFSSEFKSFSLEEQQDNFTPSFCFWSHDQLAQLWITKERGYFGLKSGNINNSYNLTYQHSPYRGNMASVLQNCFLQSHSILCLNPFHHTLNTHSTLYISQKPPRYPLLFPFISTSSMTNYVLHDLLNVSRIKFPYNENKNKEIKAISRNHTSQKACTNALRILEVIFLKILQNFIYSLL